ncbi:MAG TPA: hypothetical protein VHC23_01935 [Jatrophihabitans sp.]|nr:hypothetical protein [Jatrophihabitans sp.]
MSEVPAATLRACAEQLRELARKQRTAAGACESLLDGVTRLDDEQTWQGSYPDAAHKQFTDWVNGLNRTVDELRGEAASWSSLADDFDRRAAQADRHG